MASRISFQVVYSASGSIWRARATRSRSPSTKTMGTGRVAFCWRSKVATATPCDGIRLKSITKASGGLSRRARIAAPLWPSGKLSPVTRVAQARGAFLSLRGIPVNQRNAAHGLPLLYLKSLF